MLANKNFRQSISTNRTANNVAVLKGTIDGSYSRTRVARTDLAAHVHIITSFVSWWPICCTTSLSSSSLSVSLSIKISLSIATIGLLSLDSTPVPCVSNDSTCFHAHIKPMSMLDMHRRNKVFNLLLDRFTSDLNQHRVAEPQFDSSSMPAPTIKRTISMYSSFFDDCARGLLWTKDCQMPHHEAATFHEKKVKVWFLLQNNFQISKKYLKLQQG